MRSRRVIILAAVLVAVLLALVFAAPSAKRRAESMQCGNYLVAIGCAARMWANDHADHFPSDLLSMSNELVATKILICPGDHSQQRAASWASFAPERSSYEIVTPGLRDGDTNGVFLRCKIHGSVCYGDGSVFVNG